MSSRNKRFFLRQSPLLHVMMLGICTTSFFATPLYAMQAIDDQVLSNTTGADGIALNVQASSVAANSIYWQDPTTSSSVGSAFALQNVTVTGNPNTSPFTAQIQVNTGSSGTIPALSINLVNLSPILFQAPTVVLCSGVTTGAPSGCGTSLGALTVQTLNPLTASLVTTNGLLNSQGGATLKLLLQKGNIYFASNGNQLIASDIYANINATGRIWIDATDGFRFSTSGVTGGGVTLTAPGSWTTSGIPINAGLQTSLTMASGTAVSSSGPSQASTGLAFGVSGSLPTLDLTVRGASASGVQDNVGGTVGGTANSSILGSAGGGNAIAANMTASLQSGTGSNAFSLFLGGAGTGGYGVDMSNFVPFSNVTSTTNPTITTGNVYLNLVTSSTTKLIMPVPTVLTGSNGAVAGQMNYFNSTLAGDTTTDLQSITVPASGSLLFAVRGLSIQGVPLQTQFYQNGVGLCTGTTTCTTGTAATGFAIMPVLYNVNGNMTLNANTSTNIAYSLALAMTGNNNQIGETGNTPASDVQSSAFFLADTVNKQYVGLRDINLYMTANGVMSLTNSGNTPNLGCPVNSNCLNLTLPNFMLAMKAGLATGFLPGAEGAATGYSSYSFYTAGMTYPKYTDNKDTLFTMNLGLQSDATNNTTNQLSLITSQSASNSLGFGVDLTLAGTVNNGAPNQANAGGNFYRIIDNSGSAMGLDNMTGRLQIGSGSQIFVGSVANPYNPDNISGISANTPVNSATLRTYLTVNPSNIQGNELLTTLDFYPVGAKNAAGVVGGAQPVGNIVLTGGTIQSNLTLTPVNINVTH